MRNKLKCTISAALACVLLLALLPASALAAGQADHWAAEYIQIAADCGWVDADKADPDQAISRADFAVILWKALGSPAAQGECPFTDVTGDAAQAAITALAEQGIVEGSGDSFGPDRTLARQEGITMLARAFELKADNANAAADFTDWADVADYAKDAVAAMVEQGIVNGVGGNRLAPAKEITLGEMIKILVVTESMAPSAIVSVSTIGFVDTDGAKVSAIVVEYGVDLTGADVSVDDFIVDNYGISQGDAQCEIGSDPGKPVKAYVNDTAEVSASGGSGTGKYVIIEVNTDYQLGSVASSYKLAMYAGVRQIGTIVADSGTIAPSLKEIGNYTETEVAGFRGSTWYNYANDGAYTILGIDKFELFTKEDGTAFHATNCFEEATGEYVDVDLPYALYVPEDYDASKEYALVLQVHDAGFMGDDPMITLTESQGCANFASDAVQQIVKDQGLGGLIVVAPQINNDLRSTRDNWSLSAAVPATWQLLDSLTEKYNISMDHIYGTGQSMGGMQVVAMAAQRDNYFAGIWANGCQWGTNYNLEEEYSGASYYAAPADGELIWTVDADGNEVDYRNWYYMVSDDNILITNCAGDKFSTQTWRELDYLYHDLAGTDLIYETYTAIWNPLTATKEEQNAAATAIMEKAAAESDLGFVWTAFEGGNHMATWIYSHGVFAHYEWLLTQTRQSEMERGKLECLTNNFEYADEQDTSEARELAPDADGNMVYYATGKAGAGTADYNGCWLKMGNSTLKAPNWKPGE